MKKLTYFLLVVPLMVVQCSDSEEESDCGCTSAKVVQNLKDYKGTLYTSGGVNFYIFPDSSNTLIDGVGPSLFPCDTLIFKGRGFKDGSKIIFTGDSKPTCIPNEKSAGTTIVLSKVELLENGN